MWETVYKSVDDVWWLLYVPHLLYNSFFTPFYHSTRLSMLYIYIYIYISYEYMDRYSRMYIYALWSYQLLYSWFYHNILFCSSNSICIFLFLLCFFFCFSSSFLLLLFIIFIYIIIRTREKTYIYIYMLESCIAHMLHFCVINIYIYIFHTLHIPYQSAFV